MLTQARDEVRRKEWRIARYGDRKRIRDRLQSRMHPGERSGEAADRVADHALPECAIALEVLVGVDHDLAHLRRKPLEHMPDHGLAMQQLQALVDAAHTAAESAGQHDAGNIHARKLDGGAPSSRRNMALNAEGLS